MPTLLLTLKFGACHSYLKSLGIRKTASFRIMESSFHTNLSVVGSSLSRNLPHMLVIPSQEKSEDDTSSVSASSLLPTPTVKSKFLLRIKENPTS